MMHRTGENQQNDEQSMNDEHTQPEEYKACINTNDSDDALLLEDIRNVSSSQQNAHKKSLNDEDRVSLSGFIDQSKLLVDEMVKITEQLQTSTPFATEFDMHMLQTQQTQVDKCRELVRDAIEEEFRHTDALFIQLQDNIERVVDPIHPADDVHSVEQNDTLVQYSNTERDTILENIQKQQLLYRDQLQRAVEAYAKQRSLFITNNTKSILSCICALDSAMRTLSKLDELDEQLKSNESIYTRYENNIEGTQLLNECVDAAALLKMHKYKVETYMSIVRERLSVFDCRYYLRIGMLNAHEISAVSSRKRSRVDIAEQEEEEEEEEEKQEIPTTRRKRRCRRR